jgi:hypothetical protein
MNLLITAVWIAARRKSACWTITSLRLVIRRSCDPVGSVKPVIHEVRDHALGGVLQIVTVVHPDARVVRHESDVVALVRQDVERVDPPRATAGCHTIASQHDHVMAVQVHRMHFAAAVLDMHHYDVALTHHIHWNVREEVAIDRPPHARAAFHKPGPAANQIVESAGCLRWIKPEWRW